MRKMWLLIILAPLCSYAGTQQEWMAESASTPSEVQQEAKKANYRVQGIEISIQEEVVAADVEVSGSITSDQDQIVASKANKIKRRQELIKRQKAMKKRKMASKKKATATLQSAPQAKNEKDQTQEMAAPDNSTLKKPQIASETDTSKSSSEKRSMSKKFQSMRKNRASTAQPSFQRKAIEEQTVQQDQLSDEIRQEIRKNQRSRVSEAPSELRDELAQDPAVQEYTPSKPGNRDLKLNIETNRVPRQNLLPSFSKAPSDTNAPSLHEESVAQENTPNLEDEVLTLESPLQNKAQDLGENEHPDSIMQEQPVVKEEAPKAASKKQDIAVQSKRDKSNKKKGCHCRAREKIALERKNNQKKLAQKKKNETIIKNGREKEINDNISYWNERSVEMQD